MFGNVVEGKMQLNDIGQLVEQEWLNTINIRHDDVRLHNYIVMPNHFHAIIEIRRGESHSPQSHSPQSHSPQSHSPYSHSSQSHLSQSDSPSITNECNINGKDLPQRMKSPSKTIGAIVRGFKGAVSRQLGYSVWQRNYYEHIIRTDESHRHISNYIENNPTKWQSDKLYSP
jgi:REP element-mobilizing transposase RayT